MNCSSPRPEQSSMDRQAADHSMTSAASLEIGRSSRDRHRPSIGRCAAAPGPMSGCSPAQEHPFSGDKSPLTGSGAPPLEVTSRSAWGGTSLEQPTQEPGHEDMSALPPLPMKDTARPGVSMAPLVGKNSFVQGQNIFAATVVCWALLDTGGGRSRRRQRF